MFGKSLIKNRAQKLYLRRCRLYGLYIEDNNMSKPMLSISENKQKVQQQNKRQSVAKIYKRTQQKRIETTFSRNQEFIPKKNPRRKF